MQSSPRIEELKQKFHENPRRYFAPLANEYRKAGDPEQAIAICRAHLAQQPGHMSGHVVYGQALYDAHRTDEAHEVFQLALALDPENIIVLRHLGDIARQRGDIVEARSWYSRALDGDPHDAEVAAYLAELTEPLVSGGGAEESAVPAAPDTANEPTALADDIEKEPASPYAEPYAEPYAAPYAEVDAERASVADVPEALALSNDSPYLEPAEKTTATAGEAHAAAAAVRSPADRESRPTPTSESFPIVTRTLAELYLEQGHIEPALDIYRRLAAHEPEDPGIRARIEELSAGEHPDALVGAANDAASEHSTELWDTADSWGGGFFTDTEEADEIFGMPDDALPVGTGRSDERTSDAVEPDPIATAAAAVVVDTPRPETTVREFFATLGTMRPPLQTLGGGTEPIADVASVSGEFRDLGTQATDEPYPIADDAFARLFGDAPVSPEDSRAAAALSSAVAHGAPFSTPLAPDGPPPRRGAAAPGASDQPAQESEEDIRRFREWLDGLAET